MLPAENTDILIPTRPPESGTDAGFFSHKAGDPLYLVVHDLHTTLAARPELDISRYHEVYDTCLMERLAYLGESHSKYAEFKPQHAKKRPPLPATPAGVQADTPLPASCALSVLATATGLANTLKERNGLNHYLKTELLFASALVRLSRNGCRLNRAAVRIAIKHLPAIKARTVQELQRYGVEDISEEGLRRWCLQSQSPRLRSIGENHRAKINLKACATYHPVFALCKMNDKIDRSHRLLRQLGRQGSDILRPSYQTVGTATLRCTSSRPNLMGLPKEFRPLIIPRTTGWRIVELDYCQMDVGVIAGLSGDQTLIDDFNTGDIYSRIGVVLGTERAVAKQIVLAILYGVQANTLQSWLGVADPRVPAGLLGTFFNRYPRLSAYLQELERAGKKNGYAECLSGVRRYCARPSTAAKPRHLVRWEKNWFRNFPVQATSATIFKNAIIRIGAKVSELNYNLLVPLHDSIVFEAPETELKEAITITASAMYEAFGAFFPKLQPRLSFGSRDTGCWNRG